MSKTEKNISWKQNLFCIWLGQLLAIAGTSMVIPFIPLFIRDRLGVTDDGELAVKTAFFYSIGMLSFCLANPLWGAVGDRCGRKLMLMRAYFITAFTFPAVAFMPTWGCMLLMRFISSMFSGTVSAAQALVAVTAPDEHQGFALGTLSAAFWAGNMLGMVAGGVVAQYYGYTTAFFIMGCFFFIGGLLTLFFVHENFEPPPKLTAQERRSWLPDFSATIWGLLCLFFFFTLARRCDEPFLAILVSNIGGAERSALHTGFITALSAVGGILSGTVFGMFSDRCKTLTLAIPAMLVAGCFMLLQASADSLILLGLARFMIFFAVGGLEPIFLALLSHTVNADRRGSVFGWCASFRMFGGMGSSLLGSCLVLFGGVRTVLVFGALLMMVLVLPVICIVRRINKSTEA